MTHCQTEKAVAFGRRVRKANVVTGQRRKARRDAIVWDAPAKRPMFKI